MKKLILIVAIIFSGMLMQAQEIKYHAPTQWELDKRKAQEITRDIRCMDQSPKPVLDIDISKIKIEPLKVERKHYVETNVETSSVYYTPKLDLDNNSVTVPQHTTMVSIMGSKGSSIGYVSIVR